MKNFVKPIFHEFFDIFYLLASKLDQYHDSSIWHYLQTLTDRHKGQKQFHFQTNSQPHPLFQIQHQSQICKTNIFQKIWGRILAKIFSNFLPSSWLRLGSPKHLHDEINNHSSQQHGFYNSEYFFTSCRLILFSFSGDLLVQNFLNKTKITSYYYFILF